MRPTTESESARPGCQPECGLGAQLDNTLLASYAKKTEKRDSETKLGPALTQAGTGSGGGPDCPQPGPGLSHESEVRVTVTPAVTVGLRVNRRLRVAAAA